MFFVMKETNRLENLCVIRRIILKAIFKEWYGRTMTGLVWLRFVFLQSGIFFFFYCLRNS